ncbi:MAG: NAD(P)/FAD-dependent oxidoreductase [Aquificaceae bacterium]|nr:NAD(P)/FAD-dependent oxidoreductase [Aquificaceae bacterium]
MRKVDVLVVGGGPAGATCAYELADKGLKVLIVDIKRRIGTPVQCAEFVPIQLYHKFKEFFPQEAIAQRVENMLHFTPWGYTFTLWSEGYVLNREVFDYHIASLAVQKGAELLLRTRFVGFEDGLVWLENIDRRETFPVSTSFVVGADGPRSKVARLTGKATENFLTTAQVTLPLKERLKDLLIYFREYIPGGYGWVFPKGDLANVGVGIDPKYPIGVMESLRRFLEELLGEGIVENESVKKTGGWIPAEGLLPLLRGRVLLVGDAGGFCHPITGGGIANAVLSGSMAGKSLIRGRPEEFEEEAQDIFGHSLWRAAEKRRRHMKRWDNLKEIIPRTWIAFEEYWSII